MKHIAIALCFLLAVAFIAYADVIPVVRVTASSDDTNVPANTLDGDLSTRWSALGDGEWIEYDLGSVQTVTGVALAWYKGNQRTSSFDLMLSSDKVSWVTAFSGKSSGLSLALQPYRFSSVQARYVRYVGHGSSVNSWNSVTEVEILGAFPTSTLKAPQRLTIYGSKP